MRILLVEDSDPLRRLFARLLTMNAFEVREASDGHEALELIAGFTPDVVLTDLMMPRVEGVELIRRLRAMTAWASLPIVVMTAITGGGGHALEAGANRVLPKPLDFSNLLECLSDYGRSGARPSTGNAKGA